MLRVDFRSDRLFRQSRNLIVEPGQLALPVSIVWQKFQQPNRNGLSLPQRGQRVLNMLKRN
jgi:hypothetical protein